MLHGLLSEFSDAFQERLRSRSLFVPAVQNLLNNLARLGMCTSQWTDTDGKARQFGRTNLAGK